MPHALTWEHSVELFATVLEKARRRAPTGTMSSSGYDGGASLGSTAASKLAEQEQEQEQERLEQKEADKQLPPQQPCR